MSIESDDNENTEEVELSIESEDDEDNNEEEDDDEDDDESIGSDTI